MGQGGSGARKGPKRLPVTKLQQLKNQLTGEYGRGPGSYGQRMWEKSHWRDLFPNVMTPAFQSVGQSGGSVYHGTGPFVVPPTAYGPMPMGSPMGPQLKQRGRKPAPPPVPAPPRAPAQYMLPQRHQAAGGYGGYAAYPGSMIA